MGEVKTSAEVQLLTSYHEESQAVTTGLYSPASDLKKRQRRLRSFNISLLIHLVITVGVVVFCLWVLRVVRDLKKEIAQLQETNIQLAATAKRVGISLDNHTTVLDWHHNSTVMMNAHHGIERGWIAHLHGNDSTVREVMKSEKHYKDGNRGQQENGCYTLEDGNVWCDIIKRFSTRASGWNAYFPYFVKAPWMTANLGSQYNVEQGYQIVVLKSGMYLITGHVQFFLPRRTAQYGMMRIIKGHRDKRPSDSETLGACAAEPVTSRDTDQSYHCSVSQVAQLEARNFIYMIVSPFTYFHVSPDQLHLTVIKLCDVE